ncbi:hypothetical protein BHQ15_09780 [Mycolicibacillus koreensis]|nr:hypothetical protein BHQ15_09780 [Mycolicibacillus koreensis]
MTPSWSHDDILHGWWVRPGRLLAGEYPAFLDKTKGMQKRRVLLEAGVDSIVDLTEAGESSWSGVVLEDYRGALNSAADELGVGRPAYVRHPIPDRSTIADAALNRIIVVS